MAAKYARLIFYPRSSWPYLIEVSNSIDAAKRPNSGRVGVCYSWYALQKTSGKIVRIILLKVAVALARHGNSAP
jgi:hypothetical protein